MDPDLPPVLHDAQIQQFVGRQAFERGLEYHLLQRVQDLEWDSGTRQISAYVRGSGAMIYRSIVTFTRALEPAIAVCSCPVHERCKHTAALMLTAAEAAGRTRPAQVEKLPPWRRRMDAMLDRRTERRLPAPLGVHFEVINAAARGRKARHTIGLRPVTLNDKGRWVFSNLRWGGIGTAAASPYYPVNQPAASTFDEAQERWMHDFHALHDMGYSYPYVNLERFSSPMFWRLLSTADEAGIVLRSAAGVVTVHDPVAVGLDVADANGKLRLSPTLRWDDEGPAGEPAAGTERHLRVIGTPGHGMAWWDEAPDQPARTIRIHLAPAMGTIPDVVVQLLEEAKPLEIPRNGRDEFVSDYMPELVRRARVSSSDGAVQIPERAVPRLRLTVGHFRRAGTRKTPDVTGVRLSWRWDPRAGQQAPGHPLLPDGDPDRDVVAEASLLRTVIDALGDFPHIWEGTFPQPLLNRRGSNEPVELTGVDAARFSAEALPRLEAIDHVEIDVDGDPTDYVELTEVPQISVSASETDSSDWFDLGVQVHLGTMEVPFDQLFVALARGDDYLLLEDGSYFSLANPEYRQLRRLIEEARTLQDREANSLRISRHQASLWDELVELSVDAHQAESWQKSVGGLLELERIEPAEPPAGLSATMRRYQQEGYSWLAFLHDHGLGGVLADDMGLGKTLQTLALMLHVKERDARDGVPPLPFLVVAPTSVVPNWAAEAHRFAPDLRTIVVSETLQRTGRGLASILDGVDVVVTSYALFRLDNEEYAQQRWAGLVLDEAQFVKNPATKAAAQARSFPASFKLAITGTPMENNLSELWSMFAITSPGLFPSAKRFEELYRKPIEKDGDRERLAQLRRRIRPLIMRRTKELVATELPPKQEQVLELELSPRHRTIYQRHLQRERQKVLGMIDELDKNRFQIFRSLTMLRQLSLDASLVDEKYAGVSSSKLDALLEQLEDIVSEGHSALVFSQFTSFLGRAAQRLDEAGIRYAYLDGGTRSRGKVIESFTGGTVPVFLISLKAGGFGLNLTQADYCFLLDPWWNPASENQAVDRAHRIGQTRNVMVYRMVSKDTIEEKVMALKAKKAQLFSSVMDEDAAFGAVISADDVKSLFEG
ncbi:SNF2-related protein [Arthrobacter sp.]|uniref:DEAD/DEAH box helicase n=1 Tax=Arthrobacter sp. TaxID=1667 RepID=UPI003A94779B